MAKRKRLTPAQTDYLSAPPASGGRLAPIAQISADAASASALEAVSQEMFKARREGRMVLSVPLAAIKLDHLSRDRVDTDGDALEELKASLRKRGQQSPIEVLDLTDEGEEPNRYGLISGWRRCLALSQLYDETGETRFAEALAFVRSPATSAESYVAMVEENEIRQDLSLYEKARIVMVALQDGVFESEKQALQKLFASVTFAKRSKIKSFLPVVAALDGVCRFPSHISERLGLALSKRLREDPDFVAILRKQIAEVASGDAGQEADALVGALSQNKRKTPRVEPKPLVRDQKKIMRNPAEVAPGISCSAVHGRVVLTGEGVDLEFLERLQAFLRAQT